ncbi:hypothetical protein BC938DRAFT_476700 [Jimgerdemannia flammicorona]|uniref:Uncharacterized protein n=1 Tax=Jimgerdemannia flammicorona TaxID=994334 RepID=A0A433QQ94_9FUNG|nr:hypothetical protein BC938DRAFT_476700 [Jimgerdemannia flammicorona]
MARLIADQLDIITIADPTIVDPRIRATASALTLFGWGPHTVAARHVNCVYALWSCRALMDEFFGSEGESSEEQRDAS